MYGMVVCLQEKMIRMVRINFWFQVTEVTRENHQAMGCMGIVQGHTWVRGHGGVAAEMLREFTFSAWGAHLSANGTQS